MSSNTSENDSSFSLLNNTDKDGLDGQNENRIDDDSHSKGSDVIDATEKIQNENNVQENAAGPINDSDQIQVPNPTHSDTNRNNVPLLAPIVFNRPPFDVEGFRRQMANIHRQGEELFENRNMEYREQRMRGNSPPPVHLNREVAQIGLNDTPLTRSLAMGDFDLAESIIMTINDPEYLNDGEHADTPLNIALDGRSTYVGKPRNLKIARLLVERGADANFRVPDNDLGFGQSESPIERLLIFYLDLLKMFKVNIQSGDAHPGNNGAVNLQLDDFSELLDTIGLNGESDLTSESLIQQTRFLLDVFFAHGADVNLHTTVSSRSIFHSVLCAEVTDPSLIEMMAQKGALINLTDVHGTTPFMDVIRYTDRAIATYIELKSLGKQLNLDVQNCSGDCALFRALFRGQIDTATLLLNEGESTMISRETRVQEAKPKRPSRQFRFSSYFRRKIPIRSIPAIMAPILCDSPCYTVNKRTASFSNSNKNEFYNISNKKRTKFAVQAINNVIRANISPLVDKGWFCQNELDQWIRKHIITHTDYKNLTENKVFQEDSMIPLMFGHLSSGLRQQCLRQLLVNILFNENSEAVVTMLRNLDRPSTSASHRINSTTRKNKAVCKISTKLEEAYQTDSACVLQSTLSDSAATADKARSTGDEGSTGRSSHINLSESDLPASVETAKLPCEERPVSPFRTSTPRLPNSSPRRRAVSLNVGVNQNDTAQDGNPNLSGSFPRAGALNHPQIVFEGGSIGRTLRERRSHNERRIGENWLLRPNNEMREHHDQEDHRGRLPNSYRPIRRYRNRPFRSLEGIELEISNNAGRIHGNAISESRQRVSRIRQMLEETDDMLQRLQLQVEEVQTERIARENDQILNRADELAEHCSQIGDQVAALEQFNQQVLMQGRNVLVTIKNTEDTLANTEGAISNEVENASQGSSNLSRGNACGVSNSLDDRSPQNARSSAKDESREKIESISKTGEEQEDYKFASQGYNDLQRKVEETSNPRFDRLIQGLNSNIDELYPNSLSSPRSETWRTRQASELYQASSGDTSSSSSSDNDSFLATSGKFIIYSVPVKGFWLRFELTLINELKFYFHA